MVEKLLSLGADASLRCKWTDMIALHYAAYFNVAPVVETLLRKSKVNLNIKLARSPDYTSRGLFSGL